MVKHGIPLHHYRPFIGPGASPDVLSYICKRWRTISLSMPKLWSAFTIFYIRDRFKLDPKYERQFIATLRKWLVRSKDSPLQFSCLSFDTKRKIITALFHHIHRWQIVYLQDIKVMDAFHRQLSDDLLKAKILHTVEYRRCYRAWNVSFMQLPSLRRFAVDDSFAIVDEPGRLNLTHLGLTQLEPGETKTFFEYLQQFPSLTNFRVSVHCLKDRQSHIPSTLLTHAALTEFSIAGYAPSVITILANIHLPAIRRLRVDVALISLPLDELEDALDIFIQRHKLTFTDLEIAGHNTSQDVFVEMLHMFPEYLTWCQFTFKEITDEMVRALLLNPSDPSDNLAPNLSHISLTFIPSGRHSEPIVEEYPSDAVVLEMVLSRWEHNPRTTFVLSAGYPGLELLSDARIASQIQQDPGLLLLHKRGIP